MVLLTRAGDSKYSCSSLSGGAWTCRKGRVKRQLDYLMVDPTMFKFMCACYVSDDVHIVSDHRPVVAKLRCSLSRRALRTRSRKKSRRWTSRLIATLLISCCQAEISTEQVQTKTWLPARTLCRQQLLLPKFFKNM